jgi:peroxiredoxin
MKKLLFLFLLPAFAFMAPSKNVKLTGHMQFAEPVTMIYLSYRTADARVSDSTHLKNGKFQFKEKINEPTLAFLRVKFAQKEGQKRPRYEGMQLFMEPGKMQIDIKDSLKFAKVSGSKSHKALEAFNDLQKPYNERATALSNQYREYAKAKDKDGMKKISDEFDELSKEKNEKVFHKYLMESPGSPIALYVLEQYAGYDIDPSKVEPLFKTLPASTRNLPSAVAFKKRIETAKKTGVGAYAMNFTQNDTLGNPVSLSSFKGKYVLLDFWASWCGPCRAENPNVVKAFNKYNDKNFTVLSVSLDQPGKKQSWLDAIHKDGLTWTHVSDLKFWDNAVAKQYGIRAIPQNLLIDPTGKIIAKNIRGEELNKKLAEVFQ